jgi:hypothetical protein
VAPAPEAPKPAPAGAGANGKAAASPAKADAAKPAAKGTPAEAVVPAASAAPAAPAPVFTEADLDAALADVEKAKRGEVGNWWDHGNAINRIFKDKLYLQRRDKGGKPRYETWGQFAAEELGMSTGNTYKMMDVAANYDRATAIERGVRTLNALLRVEDVDDRAKLLADTKGKSADDVEVAVQAYVAKKQGGKTAPRGRLTPAQEQRQGKATQGSKAKADKGKADNVASASPKDSITVALAAGRTTVKLFCKGEKVGDPNAKRAKTLKHAPFGVEESANGVTTRYSLTQDAKGQLVLVIERKRNPS